MLLYAVSNALRRQQLTATNRLMWPALGALRAAGTDVNAVLSGVNLDQERAFAPDGRVQLDQLFGVWQVAAERADAAGGLGVRLAGFAHPLSRVSWPMPLALFEHLGMYAASLAEAIALNDRFVRLLRDGIHMRLDLEGDRALFRLEATPGEPPIMVEFNTAICFNVARRVAARDLRALEVWFSHPAPPKAEVYKELFQADVRFSAPFDVIIARAEDFTRPLPTANETIRAHLVREADQLLSALPSMHLIEDKVGLQIEAELPDGNTNAAAVAEKLGVSSRTLHRKLHQEGTSYQELLDRVRFRLAVRHLASGKAISEVAVLVGFAQASTFHRAFKSWTGETPAEYQSRERDRIAS